MFQQTQINDYFRIVNKQSDFKVNQKGGFSANKVQHKMNCVRNNDLNMSTSDSTEFKPFGLQTEPERRYLPNSMVINLSSDDDDFQEKKSLGSLRSCKTSPKKGKISIAKRNNKTCKKTFKFGKNTKRKICKRLKYDDSSEISSQKTEFLSTDFISEIKNNGGKKNTNSPTKKIDVISNIILQTSVSKSTENNKETPYKLISLPSTSKQIFPTDENRKIISPDLVPNNTENSRQTQNSPSTSKSVQDLNIDKNSSAQASTSSIESIHSQLTQNNTSSLTLNTVKEKDSLQSTSKNAENLQSSSSTGSYETEHSQLTQISKCSSAKNISNGNKSEGTVQNHNRISQSTPSTEPVSLSNNSTSKETNSSTGSGFQTNNNNNQIKTNSATIQTSEGNKTAGNTLKGKQIVRASQNNMNTQNTGSILQPNNNAINIQHKEKSSTSQTSEESQEKASNNNENSQSNSRTKSNKTISFEVSFSQNSPPKITIHGSGIMEADSDYNIIIQTPGLTQNSSKITTNDSSKSNEKDLNLPVAKKKQNIGIQTSPITSDVNNMVTPIKQIGKPNVALNESVKRNLNNMTESRKLQKVTHTKSPSVTSEDEQIPLTEKSIKQMITSLLDESVKKNLNAITKKTNTEQIPTTSQILKKCTKKKIQNDSSQMTLTQFMGSKKPKLADADIEASKTSNTTEMLDMNSHNLRCENVKKIINWVFGKEFFKILFTKREEDLLNTLLNLPNPQHRIVCLRLLTLEHKWYNLNNLCEKFNLNRETIQLREMLDVLKSDFVDSDYSQEDVIFLLNHLSAIDVRNICSSFKLKLTSNNKKPANITLLLNHSLHQKTLTTLKTTEQILRDRVNKKMGICVKLKNKFRDILSRVHLLYSFTNSNIITFNEIYFLMERQQNGKCVKHNNKIDSTLVFHNRKQYARYYKAWKLRREFDEEVEQNNIHNQHLLCKQAFIELKELLEDQELVASDKYKPLFLRRFSAPWIYCTVITSGSLNLGKHHPADLCEWLEMLLKQQFYCIHKRGVWYTQLSLIKQAHLKDISSAVETIIAGLSDKLVSEIGRHELSIRGSKITKSKISQMLYDQLQCVLLPACELPEPCTIQAQVVHNYKKGGKLVYVISTTDGKEYRSVEETAIRHYITQRNYTDGMHCEGRLLIKLFYIFFWDIIFNIHVPNTFLTEIQHFPLDLSSGEFYVNRKTKIDARLKDIGNEWNLDTICQFLSKILKTHADQIASLTNILKAKSRDVTSLDSDKDDCIYHLYVRCIGRRVLSAIFERFVKNFKQFQSGLPDLFLWNKKEFKCCFVEVKSENDILSTSQILWLNYLRSVGANTEVCRVESIGSSSRKCTKKKDN